MAISSKRAYAVLDNTESHGERLKRRSLILANPPLTQGCGSPRNCVSSVTFQLHSGKSFSSFGANADSDCDSNSDFCSNTNKGYAHSFTSSVLNPKLVEAVSRYSDSEVDETGSCRDPYIRLGQSRTLGSDNTQRKKSLSRPDSFSSSSARRAQATKLDVNARERCFDYIVQSIDEVWARYCDTTSCAEAKVYGNLSSQKAAKLKALEPNRIIVSSSSGSHKPLNITDKDTESESESEISTQEDRHNPDFDDEDNSGYKSEATNPTEYETDFGDSRTVSNLPDSVKLQSLKFRLTNAKNDMEQVYDSKEEQDSCSFWRRWDMIKYSAVEMMEEDDDDEIIENVIEELEQGRCYLN